MSAKGKMLTKKELSEKLVEKHERLLEEYGKEFDLLNKLFVLQEKQDLLNHWIKDISKGSDSEKLASFEKEKKKNEDKLANLCDEIEKVTPETNMGQRKRFEFLKTCSGSHKEAISYWKSCENE